MKESSFPQGSEVAKKRRHDSYRYLPAVISIVWVMATLAAFMSGIWEYPLTSVWPVFWFVCGTQACFLLGYVLAVRGHGQRKRRSLSQRVPSRLALGSAVVTLLLFLPTSLFRTGKMLPDVWWGIRNPGLAYAATASLNQAGRTPLIEYLRLPFAFFTAAVEPIVVFYWPRLPKSVRLVGALAVSSTVALFLAMGTNKGVFDAILIAAVFLFASACSGILVVGRWKRMAIVILIILSAVGFLGFFSGVSLRAGSGISYGIGPAGIHADMTKPLLSKMPETLRTAVLGLTSYASQGYYGLGLGLALQEPFVPMYGAGSSIFLTRQVERLVGDPSFELRSYPVRVMNEDGWDAYVSWSTMYPWIASDVGFPGVLLVMVVVGWLLGRAWLGVLYKHDVFSVCLLSQMVIMLVYASANNQSVQAGEGWFAFVSTVFLWFAANSMRLRHELDHAELEVAGPMADTDRMAWTQIIGEGH